MENHVNQSLAIPKWSALLIEAVTKPGLIQKSPASVRVSDEY